MAIETDILLIGAGIAGLSLAIKLGQTRPDCRILVITKTKMGETSTRYAQGGVAAVWNAGIDDFGKHIGDTLDAGDGLCDRRIVEIVVREGPERVREIISWGARFDQNENEYDLGREGGHSENRILHYKDLTGWEIQRALIEKVSEFNNIMVREDMFAIDLLTQHHLGYNVTRMTSGIICFGAYVMDKTEMNIQTILSKVTVLASGGAGQVYKNTTNPAIATGDGIAMIYRAKGRVENMEFVQFHPTVLFNPKGDQPDFLISEAVRGFGGVLKTRNNKPFMQLYDKRESLAPRDIVARAIDNEMKKSGDEYVYLDCTHLERKSFINHFPTIYNKCTSLGIDPLKNFIPVVPACHYLCGGIKIDEYGHTSIDNLYAAGECTSSGLHGANRLASNSLLEGLVFGHRVAIDIEKNVDRLGISIAIPEWNAEGTIEPKERVLITQSWKELKEIMSSYVGIVRNDIRLKRALARLHLLYEESEELYRNTRLSPQLMELRNLITIGYLITRSAAMRKESRGLHFTTDYPEKNPFLDVTLL